MAAASPSTKMLLDVPDRSSTDAVVQQLQPPTSPASAASAPPDLTAVMSSASDTLRLCYNGEKLRLTSNLAEFSV